MTGEWPKHHVDHANGDRDDNRWVNLREATWSENKWNSKTPRNNTTGVKGVSRLKGRFRARVMVHGDYKFLGYFDTIEEAANARFAAAEEAHGEFFNPGLCKEL